MATPMILIVSGLYLASALDLYFKKQYGLSLTFFCYSIANLGIIMAGVGK